MFKFLVLCLLFSIFSLTTTAHNFAFDSESLWKSCTTNADCGVNEYCCFPDGIGNSKRAICVYVGSYCSK
ncbi:unnamed protein product, partial [Mesorhabditis belari]|uniref:Uncharacterized protein n=1 Tax=Mesorhabditis belari TaxID=2138241 RepID=A0A915GHV5_9BILA